LLILTKKSTVAAKKSNQKMQKMGQTNSKVDDVD
jgi:hypothetical protein